MTPFYYLHHIILCTVLVCFCKYVRYNIKASSNSMNFLSVVYTSEISELSDFAFIDSRIIPEKFETSYKQKDGDIVKAAISSMHFPLKNVSNSIGCQIVLPLSALHCLQSYRPIRYIELPTSLFFTTLSANGFYYPGTGSSVTCSGCGNSVQLSSITSEPSNGRYHKPGCECAKVDPRNESSNSATSRSDSYGHSETAQQLDLTANNHMMSNLNLQSGHASDSTAQEEQTDDTVLSLRDSFVRLAVTASTSMHNKKEDERRAENNAAADISPEVLPVGAEGGVDINPFNEGTHANEITDENSVENSAAADISSVLPVGAEGGLEINQLNDMTGHGVHGLCLRSFWSNCTDFSFQNVERNSSYNEVPYTARRWELRVVNDTNDVSYEEMQLQILASMNDFQPLENFTQPNARRETFNRCSLLLPWASQLAERGFFLTGRNILVCFFCKENRWIESSKEAADVCANHHCDKNVHKTESRQKKKS